MNPLQKLSVRLVQAERPVQARGRRRNCRPPEQGSWRKIMEKLARHPDRYRI